MMIVEFARLWDNNYWDTSRFDVPIDELNKRSPAGDDDWTLQSWAREHLLTQAQYRRVVAFVVLEIVTNDGE